MTAVNGVEWETCRALLEERAPGTVEQSVEDADTFFAIEPPSLVEWSLSVAKVEGD